MCTCVCVCVCVFVCVCVCVFVCMRAHECAVKKIRVRNPKEQHYCVYAYTTPLQMQQHCEETSTHLQMQRETQRDGNKKILLSTKMATPLLLNPPFKLPAMSCLTPPPPPPRSLHVPSGLSLEINMRRCRRSVNHNVAAYERYGPPVRL